VVTRGKDVAEGPRLKIDLTTGMYRFEVENEAAGGAAAAASAPPPPADATNKASTETDPSKRTCPPGKQCLLFYPKDTQDRAKEVGKKVLPNLPGKIGEGWQSNTSAGEASRRGE
jgi:hypothetical protein